MPHVLSEVSLGPELEKPMSVPADLKADGFTLPHPLWLNDLLF
jgi:hypothetical protein